MIEHKVLLLICNTVPSAVNEEKDSLILQTKVEETVCLASEKLVDVFLFHFCEEVDFFVGDSHLPSCYCGVLFVLECSWEITKFFTTFCLS